MILVDSSVWVDHLRTVDQALRSLLDGEEVLSHPLVIGEILVGNVRDWTDLRETLSDLPSAVVAEDNEVLDFIHQHSLFGIGVGYVDVHLLISAKLTPDTKLWSRDRRLAQAASRLDLASGFLPGLH